MRESVAASGRNHRFTVAGRGRAGKSALTNLPSRGRSLAELAWLDRGVHAVQTGDMLASFPETFAQA